MAYYKRVRASRKGRRYYRRRYRRYKRKYRRYRRRARRANKPEVKCCSKQLTSQVHPQALDQSNTYLKFTPGRFFIIGAPDEPSVQQLLYMMAFNKGYGSQNRIGAKITPIKFRLSGSLNIYRNSLDEPPATTDTAPIAYTVRLIVYQVQGGHVGKNPDDETFHPMAIADVNGNGATSPRYIKRVIGCYAGQDSNSNIAFNSTQWLANQNIGTTPLRRNIGGQARILYNKAFRLNTRTKPCKEFRIVTKRPRPIVWPENTSGEDNHNEASSPKNPIYCLWIFQPHQFYGVYMLPITLNCLYEIFYKDA